MTIAEVREKYLSFFEKRGHAVIPSAPLVPENDPTTLFTGSGMQPLLPFLLGERHPNGERLVDSQKCFRAEDIEEVGDNRHTTFFEMLGNWSLGDYFKKEQLEWFFEFLTAEIGLDPERLYVTVFSGDQEAGIPRDDESVVIWKELFGRRRIEAKDVELVAEENARKLGMHDGRIFYYDAKKNWWSRAGVPENMPVGEPGGPDSEVFFDFDPTGAMHDEYYGKHCHPNCDCGRFVEIGNSVFMQYVKRADGGFDELPQKNVDFGGGLERITAASNGDPDVFSVDALRGVISRIEELSGSSYNSDEAKRKSFRIIADHLRGVAFMIADGVTPSNTEQGYFVRRLLRRAIRHTDLLGMRENSLHTLAPPLVAVYSDHYPVLEQKLGLLQTEIEEEEARFRQTLARGMREFERRTQSGNSAPRLEGLSGKDAFDLYQTYGFPLEMTLELADEQGITVDEKKFREEFTKHQEISRAGSAQKFKGGLADHSDMSLKYHTATHLLHQALRDVLGDHVYQKGSNITPERLRFDFVHGEKMTDEEKKQVEDIVNQKIDEALPVSFEMISLDEAKERGAIGLFDDQYGDTVKVYKVGPTRAKSRADGLYSFEFCGGPHVANTKILGELSTHSGQGNGKRLQFKIKKEEAISAGVRRIRAVLE